ncbi:acetyl-CoA carboxylase biotin carboxyl carrier protein [Clostridium fallax]|uniref:Biotin carboxyl carrier protein of acetyl-CoA carboxylase n=1 Tax=Clostridium fallax TaxID=1533 RepID=A0A1M4VTD9_9CLOT|nr:acetyl-CoA carboxylase biotin carboxyl carrier protein [Clostridium fallax]SHE72120.1 acetyl-CoA carboxylase biotin carboxyl carrier protein [Clostridium fallax]SQB07678.1 acetyl-CoA carboxylase biotin carboxyl carrier protein [Clostridium fallax]
MDYSSIKELISIINDSKLTTFEMELDGVVLKMKKGESSSQKKDEDLKETHHESKSKVEKKRSELKEESINSAIKIEDIEEKEEINGEMVNAPLVGTFYSSPGEGKDNFVKIGDNVKKGDVLCILEAMKIMNEIQSPRDGKIVKILVENEQMVEYGQPLFIIE